MRNGDSPSFGVNVIGEGRAASPDGKIHRLLAEGGICFRRERPLPKL
jgi:hypothetical protein